MQTVSGPAGIDALRETLDPWLGKPRWKQTAGRVTFSPSVRGHAFPAPEGGDQFPRALFSVWARKSPFLGGLALVRRRFRCRMRWTNFSLPSCVRSINARKAGTCLTWRLRWTARQLIPAASSRHFPPTWRKTDVTRALFERNLAAKLRDRQFSADPFARAQLPVGHGRGGSNRFLPAHCSSARRAMEGMDRRVIVAEASRSLQTVRWKRGGSILPRLRSASSLTKFSSG